MTCEASDDHDDDDQMSRETPFELPLAYQDDHRALLATQDINLNAMKDIGETPVRAEEVREDMKTDEQKVFEIIYNVIGITHVTLRGLECAPHA